MREHAPRAFHEIGVDRRVHDPDAPRSVSASSGIARQVGGTATTPRTSSAARAEVTTVRLAITVSNTGRERGRAQRSG